MKAERNKTIDMTVEEGKIYLDRCVRLFEKAKLENILDKTIVGDTFQNLTLLPENFVDLLIVDPPYNLAKNYHGNQFKKTSDELYEEYTESWIQRVKPLLKENATIYVCCDWKSSLPIEKVLKSHFHIQNRITWQREKGRGALSNWKNGMEDIWFATNSADYTFHVDAVKIRRKVVAPYKVDGAPKDWEETEDGNFRNTYPSNFWDDISIPYWSMPENTAHPTQKPEKLLAKLILASSNPGDVILDPFLGSGSTSVTAKKLGRHYVGIEQNEQYCCWTEKRLEMAEKDVTIQGYADGVFWERNTTALQQRAQKK
ncbi:MAG: site-specific DNA-methyltransferase [Hallerella porci]|uniref:Methyltransferase n=2 Tax=Fibrobacteraceae TaxID=204431 RepID=A0ABX5LNB2_9BACT|nr:MULTISPECIES: site-specific DNA-methyltransferase [Hallerella]MCI5601071.1 site-specific DNA-methyltransferase [Hallerella sp.]MDY3921394.1 site-specific DNA-methyltransferase [Hallerella porci]PWL03896.1 site-specific DNA-methyltransferase (adenine-specific) [Hallerella porci]